MVTVLARLEGDSEDDIRVAVVCNHDVLVAPAAANRGLTHVISLEPDNMSHMDVKFTQGLGDQGQ